MTLPLSNSFTSDFLDLDKTLSSGQCFGWVKVGDTWYGSTIDGIIKIKQEMDLFHWQTYPVLNNTKLIREYFQLDRDYTKFKEFMSPDKTLSLCYNHHKGLIVLKQDFLETTINFLLSSNKNIKAIEKIMAILSGKFGDTYEMDGLKLSTFPTLSQLKNITMQDLKEMSAGYRAEYVYSFINNFDPGIDQESITHEFLTTFKGIGPKVADCILTFSLNRTNITPLDVWGFRFLEKFYGLKTSNYAKATLFYQSMWGDLSSLVGQYLFEYVRNNWEVDPS